MVLTEDRNVNIHDLDGDIEDVINILKEWQRQGIKRLDFRASDYEAHVFLLRPETEEEEQERRKQEEEYRIRTQAFKEKQREKEYNKYLELKKKFEEGV